MSSSSILQPGQKLQTASGLGGQVIALLGGGGQGEVYKVSFGNQALALKWYFPESATEEQLVALDKIIHHGAPTSSFLWPQELVAAPGHAGFGYLMALRPLEYRGIQDLLGGLVTPTFRARATMAYQLADSYFQLHTAGLCYCDISFGNAFFRPDTGDVLVCDNDNVTVDGSTVSGVLGTQGFMAPEIVRREAFPSSQTDLFSLAVLLFYLFIFHHPLEGAKEAAVDNLDPAARHALYGSNPIFIFDPYNHSNAPVPGYQDAPLFFWPIYPTFLRELFTRAFTTGLHPQGERVRENEWRAAMIRLRDAIFYCQHCKGENFYDAEALKQQGGYNVTCWQCHKSAVLPFRMRVGNQVVMLNHDTKLYPHHIDSTKKGNFSQPVAEVVHHPTNPHIWGLKNLSDAKWVLTKEGGSLQEVERERSVTLDTGVKINFGNTEGEIRY